MLKPRALRSGDRLAVVAPASPFDVEVFERGVQELVRLGFEPTFDDGVFARHGYVAGSAEHRARALMEAWADPSVAGVFAVRGGYGSAQMLPLVDVELFRATPKTLVGCSDVTALLVFLTTCCGMTCFHGPMLVNLADGPGGYDQGSLLGSVGSPRPPGELRADGVEAVRPGEARGVLLGGTLTQLVSSLSTPYAFAPPPGYVLLLDDVGEAPYRIDRMLTQLIQAGIVGRASAVVCAEFPRCRDADGRDARTVIAEHLGGFAGPVLFNFPTGHTHGPLWTLPLGVEVTVTTRSSPARVIVEEAAVR